MNHIAYVACQVCLFQHHGETTTATTTASWNSGSAVLGGLAVLVLVVLAVRHLFTSGNSKTSAGTGKKRGWIYWE